MFCPEMKAFQLVPLSVLMNVNTSRLLSVDVTEGAVLPGHLNDAGQATVLKVPSAVKTSTKLTALLAVEGTFDNVRVVMFALSDTSNIILLAKSSVSVPAEIVGLLSTST